MITIQRLVFTPPDRAAIVRGAVLGSSRSRPPASVSEAPLPPFRAENPSRTLLERRLVIVTGKGGTGKSTVAAALALAGARAGRRVLVAEVSADEQIPDLIAPGSPASGYQGRSLRPRLASMQIDPFEALTEYLGLQIGVPGMVRRVLETRAFRQLMNAAPGWRELITLGKVWHLEQMQEGGGPRYDLIVVDAPATGHGVAFLSAPRVVVSAVRAGPLRRHAKLVEAMLEDPERTLLLPVALAEELPTRETAELVARMREEVGIAIDRVVVNAVAPPPFPPGLEDLDRRLAALPPDQELGALPPPRTLAACASFLRSRHELNRGYARQIGASTGLPIVELPYVVSGFDDEGSLEGLSRALLAPPQEPS
jgi:anion-transporting  ArsA/GET3 family ATPase